MENTIYKKLFNVKKAWIILTRDTKAFNYKYATLDQIQEKLAPILEANNLLLYHTVLDGNVVTVIHDVSTWDEIASSIKIHWTKAQDIGSEITYYRRYNLVSLFDLPVEDDDGKKAQSSKKEKARLNEWTPVWKKCLEKRVTPKKITDHFKIKVTLLNKYKEQLKILIDEDKKKWN